MRNHLVNQTRTNNDWTSVRKGVFSTYIRRKILEMVMINVNCQVADIGAGNGFLTDGLIKRGFSRIIAIDNSKKNIGILKAKYRKHNGVDCLVSTEKKVPVENNILDFAFTYMYLHHAYLPFKTIQEIRRILKENGRIVISDFIKHDMTFLKTVQHDKWLGFTPEKIRYWLKKAGFSNIKINILNPKCVSNSDFVINGTGTNIFVATGCKS